MPFATIRDHVSCRTAFAVSALGLLLPVCHAAAQATAGPSSHAGHMYRLTYTITNSEGGKRVSIEHYTMSILSGGKAMFKEGTKQPVMTGGFVHEGTTPDNTQFQFTYIDTGLNFDAALTESAEGLQLQDKVELSSIVDPMNAQMLKDPTVRQLVVQTDTVVKPGTPALIGSLDVPGGTRHIDIEVTLERMP